MLTTEIFYFFAKIKQHNFPSRIKKTADSELEASPANSVAGHLISIEPAFTLYNLLPIEFRYRFISSSSEINPNKKGKRVENVINGKIDANKKENFANINVSNPVDLMLELDNFRMARVIEINPGKHLNSVNTKNAITDNDSTEFTAWSNKKLTVLRRVNFMDEKNLPLFLIARIVFKIGTGLRSEADEQINPCPIDVHISAVYCFFNLTGLPLIFRQYNSTEAAGQFEEHEMARNNQPLLFSFNETDSPYACSMRYNPFKNEIILVENKLLFFHRICLRTRTVPYFEQTFESRF